MSPQNGQRGGALLETAVVFPFVLLLLFAALQFYFLRHAEAAAVEAAQTAARAGSIYGLCACRRAGQAALARAYRLREGGTVECRTTDDRVTARAAVPVPVLVPLISEAGILAPGSGRVTVARTARASLEPGTPPCAAGW